MTPPPQKFWQGGGNQRNTVLLHPQDKRRHFFILFLFLAHILEAQTKEKITPQVDFRFQTDTSKLVPLIATYLVGVFKFVQDGQPKRVQK